MPATEWLFLKPMHFTYHFVPGAMMRFLLLLVIFTSLYLGGLGMTRGH